MWKNLDQIRRRIPGRIPPNYRKSFLEAIMSENLSRMIIGGVILSLVELGVLATRGEPSANVHYYPISMVLINLIAIPLLIGLRRREGGTQYKRVAVYLVVALYLLWSSLYTWAFRVARPDASIGISPYMLMVYGAAVFVYLEPVGSTALFSMSLGLFILLLPFDRYDQSTILGNVWNALALNLFAWITSYVIFVFRLRTFVNQKELEQAQAKSDSLLLNILPAKIVADLKETGTTTPEQFDHVTVLFSDIVGFTEASRQLAPEVLINELNDLFTAFDTIIEQYECERIKTIGDAYLCVCGMPNPHPRHAEQILEAALEMMAYLRHRNATHPYSWQMRVGVHSGSVVGGVVGTKKYIYDVFGDTINTSFRMEEHSRPMRINVSETTYQLTEDRFLFAERDPVPVKGIGEITMYFLKGMVPDEASQNR